MTSTSDQLLEAAAELSNRADRMSFADPVTHVYNPLAYAWAGHAQYIQRFATGPKRVLLVGMNPGPWGMAQTGVPFGEVHVVRDWLGIREPVQRPKEEHPKRLVQGLDCPRSEVSGRRLWSFFQSHFGEPEAFFKDHYVANYCPLMFVEAGGRNRTPDKLPVETREALQRICDQHLLAVIDALSPSQLVAVGRFAEDRLKAALHGRSEMPPITRLLHPSPASPAANRDWAGQAETTLVEAGVWSG